MTNSKKWSEQSLVKQTFKTQDENGNAAEVQLNTLQVCISGMDLYRKEFKEGKYKGENSLLAPFDFVVTQSGSCSPASGKFYEMEYVIGNGGMVYRALIQCGNAVTDLPYVLEALKHYNRLPEGIKPMKAWLRDDIEVVHICHCYKDGEYGPTLSGGIVRATEAERSIADYTQQVPGHSACLEYYRGNDCYEVWTSPDRKFGNVFVCGSENVNDPEFDTTREADMETLRDLLDEAEQIISDYNLPHCIIVQDDTEEGKPKSRVALNYKRETLEKILDAIYGKA